MAHEPPRILRYKVGDTTSSGRVVHFIYGQSDTCGVYRDEKGFVHVETVSEEPSPVQTAANRRYDELIAYAGEFLSTRSMARARHRLAFCLFTSMTSTNEEVALACFEQASEALARAFVVESRLWYVGASTVVAGIIGLSICWPLLSLPRGLEFQHLIGCGSGVAGAWTSVLQRISSLEPPGTMDSSRSSALQGASRVLLGGIFGVVVVAGIAADLVLGLAKDSIPATGLVAFVAGFSERYVPELLRRVENGVIPPAI